MSFHNSASADASAKGSASTPKTNLPPVSSITSPGVAAVTKGANAAEAKVTAAEAKGVNAANAAKNTTTAAEAKGEAKGEATLKSPPGWNATHDAFVKAASARGEDKKSICVLVETEYPQLGHVSEAWVQSRIDAKA